MIIRIDICTYTYTFIRIHIYVKGWKDLDGGEVESRGVIGGRGHIESPRRQAHLPQPILSHKIHQFNGFLSQFTHKPVNLIL